MCTLAHGPAAHIEDNTSNLQPCARFWFMGSLLLGKQMLVARHRFMEKRSNGEKVRYNDAPGSPISSAFYGPCCEGLREQASVLMRLHNGHLSAAEGRHHRSCLFVKLIGTQLFYQPGRRFELEARKYCRLQCVISSAIGEPSISNWPGIAFWSTLPGRCLLGSV